MKYITLFFITIACSISLIGQKKSNWKNLFNGKNLNGWVQKGGKATYTIEKGEIVGTTVSNSPNSFLCTEKEYGDFILEFEMKLDEAINSGVQFRSLSTSEFENGRVHGLQLEVDPSARSWTGGIYDEARRFWLYPVDLNPKAKEYFKLGQWIKYRVEAIGPMIRTFIDGKPVAHLIDDLTLQGFIALQVHSINDKIRPGMKIRWKNIKIQTENLKPLPFDEIPVVNLLANNLSIQEEKQGFQFLFNGKDFEGWRGVYSDKMTDKNWNVKEGILKVTPSDGSETGNDIVTQKKYASFELLFDFKLSEGANSGVKYFVDEKFQSGGKSGIGLEYQILDDEKHPDAKAGVVGNRTLASLYDLIPSTKVEKRFQRAIGEWNKGRIVVLPNNIVQHWYNGLKVVEYERKSNIFKALVARSKYEKYPGFGESEHGHILLQDHGNAVEFRSIKIRELK